VKPNREPRVGERVTAIGSDGRVVFGRVKKTPWNIIRYVDDPRGWAIKLLRAEEGKTWARGTGDDVAAQLLLARSAL